jgi:hypothetical protein
VRQGVLLLNRALTGSPDPTKTEQNTPRSPAHLASGTDAVITALDRRDLPPVPC